MARFSLPHSFVCGLLVAALSGVRVLAATQVLYVDHEISSGDGSSWSLAFSTLQDALVEADAIVAGSLDNVEIYVADGVYYPDHGDGAIPGDRAATLHLPDRTRVIGGYAGSSDETAARDIALYQSIVSGDIGTPVDFSDNSYHIVTADGVADADLDGLMIVYGNADGGGADDVGAGVNVLNSEVEITDCTLTDNSAAAAGAGIASDPGSNVALLGCYFEENLAIEGGTLFAAQNNALRITDSEFRGNDALGGAAMSLLLCESVIESSTFEFNLASAGGAAYIDGGMATFDGCDFTDNIANRGGALFLDNITVVRVVRSRFLRNLASIDGGAIYLKNCGDSANGLVGVNVLFDRNAADQDGGAIKTDGPVTLANTIFDTNIAGMNGGAIDFIQASDGDIRNCTYSANDANTGDAIYFDSTGTLVVLNTILWGATAGPIVDLGLGAVTVSYCDIRGGWAGAGAGNIAANPRFVNATTGDFRLRWISPCIDRGRNAFVPVDGFDLDSDGNTAERLPLDYLEQTRVVDGNADFVVRVDIGAIERP